MTTHRTQSCDHELSEQMRQLAAISQSIAAAAINAGALDGVLSSLVRANGWFSRALLLKGSHAGGAFVATASRGSGSWRRQWTRWPLHRLFVRMQPSRIVDPLAPEKSALAIPFSHGLDRWVVVAEMQELARDKRFDDFFRVLESFCVLQTGKAENDGPISDPMAPVVTAFALCPDLHQRVAASLGRRGWPLTHVPEFGGLSRLLKDAIPDIMVIDTHVLRDPLGAMAGIHRLVDRAALRLLVFDDGDLDQAIYHSLVDRLLPHDADAAAILRAVKDLKDESLTLRARQSDEDSVLTERRTANILAPHELVDFGAQRASEIVDGWAACFLLDERGTIYRHEHPIRERPIVRAIPKGFLGEAAMFASHVDDEFLDIITDDPAEQFAIIASGAISGASIPLLTRNGHCRGVMVACSTKAPVDSQSFRSLELLGRTITGRFDQLHSIGEAIPEFHRERLWQRLREGPVGLDVYRSADCVIPWHYEILSDSRGLLTFGLDQNDDTRELHEACLDGTPLGRTLERCSGERATFAASIDFSAQSMSYATRGFSAPMVGEGGVTVIGTACGIATGTTVLRSATATICDSRLWNWLQRRGTRVDRLPADIDEESPSGFASILTLD